MPFLQADFGWRDLTRILHLDAAFSMRAGGLYGKMDRNWYEMIDGATYRIHQSYSSIRPVFEPSIELRFGWEHFKFNLRIYTIHVLNNEYKGRPAIPSDGGGYNFGISYRFDTRRKTAR